MSNEQFPYKGIYMFDMGISSKDVQNRLRRFGNKQKRDLKFKFRIALNG